MTVTVTGGGGAGAGPEPTAAQEVQIMQKKREAKSSARVNSGHLPSCGVGNTPRGRHTPRHKSNGLDIDSAYLREFLESGAEGSTIQKMRQRIMSRIMTEP